MFYSYDVNKHGYPLSVLKKTTPPEDVDGSRFGIIKKSARTDLPYIAMFPSGQKRKDYDELPENLLLADEIIDFILQRCQNVIASE